MPRVSMGHSDSSSSTSQQVAALWLKTGGRGLDTANSYNNQGQIGAAVKASGLPRSEIFVTTKIFCAGNTSGATAAIDSDLKQLGLPSVDLMLIHRPYPYPGHPEQCSDAAQRAATWEGLERALAAGIALDVKVNLAGTTLHMYISLAILHTKYTGWRQNEFRVHA